MLYKALVPSLRPPPDYLILSSAHGAEDPKQRRVRVQVFILLLIDSLTPGEGLSNQDMFALVSNEGLLVQETWGFYK